MAGYDRQLDPLTGDYVDEEGGEYAETLGSETAVQHALKGERDRWWGDPNRGSRLYLIRTKNLDQPTAAWAENEVLAALQPLVDEKLIDAPQVRSETDARGRMVLETAMTDLATGEPLVIAPPIGGR